MRGGALFALISVISDGKAKQLLSELQKTAADAQSKIDKALAERRAVDKYKVAECERLQNERDAHVAGLDRDLNDHQSEIAADHAEVA
jgi:hypothetical protein